MKRLAIEKVLDDLDSMEERLEEKKQEAEIGIGRPAQSLEMRFTKRDEGIMLLVQAGDTCSSVDLAINLIDALRLRDFLTSALAEVEVEP